MKRILFIFMMLLIVQQTYASHILGGEINYTRISTLTYKFTVLIYTDNASAADSPFVQIDMGVGAPTINAIRIQKINISNDYSQNMYEATYTYPGAGVYKVSLSEENRGTLNNATNSFASLFYIQTTLVINPSVETVTFKSVATPIFFAKVGSLFKANLANYTNLVTDSLVFQLYPCYQANNIPLNNYQYPTGLTINSISGELVWGNPLQVGKFGIAVHIALWRNGVKISTMLRDLTIVVEDAIIGNNIPEVAANASINLSNPIGTQVAVNKKIVFRVIMNKDMGSLEFLHPTLTASIYDSLTYHVAKFEWTPTELEKTRQPYILTFRAKAKYALDKTILLYVGYPPQQPSFLTANENDLASTIALTAYPNPMQDILHFRFEQNIQKFTICLYDEKGIMIENVLISSAQQATLPTKHLKKGMYYYQIKTGEMIVKQGKLIKE